MLFNVAKCFVDLRCTDVYRISTLKKPPQVLITYILRCEKNVGRDNQKYLFFLFFYHWFRLRLLVFPNMLSVVTPNFC